MEKPQHCYSCAVPLMHPDFKGPTPNYCKYCVDEKGVVKSREQVRTNMRMWMQMWQPPAGEATIARRADAYMSAMPHWAE